MTTVAESVVDEARRIDESRRPTTSQPSSHARWYRTLWRWHFYAGLITTPILLTVAITGGLYVFIDELKPMMYPHLMRSTLPTGSVRTLDEMLTEVRRAYPQAQVVSAAEPRRPGLNAEFGVKIPEGTRTAYVDPGTGTVAGLYDEPNSFFGIVLALHRRLLAGSVGRLIVEIAVSWGVVLLMTGLYLWWPRRAGHAHPAWQGVWLPRCSGPWNMILRDWHSVIGFYTLVTAAFVLTTGLFFTQWFGAGFNWLNKQVHGQPAALANPPHSKVSESASPLSLDRAKTAAEPHLPGVGPLRLQLPTKPNETFRVSRVDFSKPTWKTTVHLDAYSGEVLAAPGWDDAPFLQKVRLSVYPIHVGSIFGMSTKVLAVLTCLALVVLCITGVWMWWRKRPRGTWGLPAPSDVRMPYPLIGCTVLFGALLPAAGASFAVVLAGDAVYRRFTSRTLGSPRRD
jgi:uncharacterized iron-regulated membrane protein